MLSVIKKNKLFRNFFLADVISGFGVGMGTVGGNWFMLAQTGSNKYVGFLATLNVLAGFLISPIAGVVIDKFNRKTVILFTFLFRAISLSFVLGFFSFFGFNLYIMYFYTIINGIGWAVYLSASRSFIQEILSEESLESGNSLVEISLQVGMFAAGAISGIIYRFSGFFLVLSINIISFLISSLLMLLVNHQSPKLQSNSQNESALASLKNGLSYLIGRKNIFLFGIISIVPLSVTMLYNVALPSYVTDIVKSDSVVFGLSDMAYGIGGLCSGFLIATVSKVIANRKIISILYVIAVINLALLGINKTVLLLFLGSYILGISNSGLRISMNTILMEKVDPRFMGRSMAVWTGLSMLIQTLSSTGIGLLIDSEGAETGFFLMSVLMMLGLVGFILISKND